MRSLWLAAIVVAALVLAGVAAISREIWPPLERARIVFIGSSITACAITPDDVAGGILGDGRPHTRLGKSATTEAESNEFLRAALRYPVEEIFVEIAAYVRDLPNSGGPAAPPWTAGLGGMAEAAWAGFGERLRDKAGLLVGRRQTGVWGQLMGAAYTTDTIYDGSHAAFASFYPLSLHPPRRPAELEGLLAEARRKGVRIVFFMTPRSQEAAAFLGPAVEAQQVQLYLDLSHRFGVEFWQPAVEWENSHFVDPGHLNRRGAARFTEALRARFGHS